MKKIVYLLLFTLVSSGVNAQKSIEIEHINKEWKTIYDENDVTIDVNKQFCNIQGVSQPFEYLFFRITNQSASEIEIDFMSHMMLADNSCSGCDADNIENHKIVTLKGGEILTGDCTFENSTLSVLLKNPLYFYEDLKPMTLILENIIIKK